MAIGNDTFETEVLNLIKQGLRAAYDAGYDIGFDLGRDIGKHVADEDVAAATEEPENG